MSRIHISNLNSPDNFENTLEENKEDNQSINRYKLIWSNDQDTNIHRENYKSHAI
jgi:hypothetical protein